MLCEWIGLAARSERTRIAEVVAAAGDDVAHPSARIVHVAEVARDDVDVKMHHRLTGSGPGVEADVVPVRRVARVEHALDRVDGPQDGLLLGRAGVEPRGDVAPGHDERVAGRDGIAISHRDHERVGPHDLLVEDGAEWADRHG